MKAVMALILLISLLSGGITAISKVNTYAQRAAAAYARQDYMEAIASYTYLLDDLSVEDDQMRLNLAHAYYQAGLYPQATAAYQFLADHPTLHLRALTHLQLGNIHTKQKKYKRALALYKQALIIEPANNEARYNYELLKKYLKLHPQAAREEEQTPNDTQPQTEEEQEEQLPPPAQEDLEPQPKQKPDNQGQQEKETEQPEPDPQGTQQSSARQQDMPEGNQEREQTAGQEPGDTEGQNREGQFAPQQPRSANEEASADDTRAQTARERLNRANMTPDKARLLLDAMRNAELQYIQQLPKKPTRKPDRSKPDW